MASSTSLHSLLFPSSSGIQPFLRRFSPSDVIPALVRMHVLGAIRLVGAPGAMGLEGLLS